jgi:hypothetical protein
MSHRAINMSDRPLTPQRLATVLGLREAALALLQRRGEQDGDRVWFGRHTAERPEPRLALLLCEIDGLQCLNVWATLQGKHAKVLNLMWSGNLIDVLSFRRGEWENELLAMGRTTGVAVH